MNNQREKKTRTEAFVSFIIERINNDKGIAAALRRADNPATEYQCWEQLAAFNIQLDNSNERLPFATVAAAIAKAKVEKNGTAGIGQALADCYDDRCENDQAKSKLRRLLACDSIDEACRILRPLFSLIHSRTEINLDYAQILDDLLNFNFRKQQIKSRWAQNFYKKSVKDKEATS